MDPAVSVSVELPDKLYFKIGEVKDIVGVKQHVLRYWESEFSTIRPQKSKTNQRLYRRKDVEAILAIKHLLYERKFTIEGAKQFIKSQGVEKALPPVDADVAAKAARKQALAEVSERVNAEKKQVVDCYEKVLFDLKQELLAYADGIDPQ